ncbi:putative leucine-rich repeat-containing, plant-type, leucine-rich repeat domain, L [Rosa chinensis]|uniref:Putative leucine-rich repeat-containing, plant-type, leucine-rich repeat domain, L n=1 Tax=Rosa chinensis TaxID=74649 RepID=A0A2P6RL37_ROSCH|nr:putative leucine-rich repeat-containing, plant-type, leucine-rich repeat domain, L [Rosa chinensis]
MFFSIMSGRSMHSILVGLFCLAIASAICCSSVGSSYFIRRCLESERHALLQFKQDLVDDSNALASWENMKDCCKWRGIACNNQTGHVTTLDFSFSYDPYLNSTEVPLRGEMSPSLLELRYLSYLDLSYNDFGGMIIPKFIGSLSQLKELKLADANFSGPVPPQLGNLSNLHTLDLSWNELVSSESIEWLSHLSSLRYLNMSDVDLSKVVNWPQSLSKLTSLIELQLLVCRLPDVNLRSLSFINSSTSLQVLDLSSNSLNSSVFHWIANVSNNFVNIQLSSNLLKGPIPDVFTSMLSLVALDLSYNQLEGGIPEGFQNLCSLESLTLLSNSLSENIIDSIKTLSCAENTLETLNLRENQFWGSLPNLKRFSKLRELDLSSNQLNGSLPESVGQLSSLEQLFLSENSLTGVITESHFLNLSRLQMLSLSDNRFSINLSSDWNPPFQLSGALDMSGYKLGPAFPKWILTQTNLTRLYLSNAGLSGLLPNKFWDLCSGLVYLNLSMNQIHGKVPNLSTTSLFRVDLSSNLLSGAVPSIPRRLSRLDLSKNLFSGPPSSLCTTLTLPPSNLYALDLSENLLSGELPNCWIQFQNLEQLNLGRNKLSGMIPSSLGSIQGIAVLRLNRNNFSGELPSLENCTSLVMVDLGDNNLSGKIPTWIGQSLIDLTILHLRSNEFNGSIPSSLCGLAAIHVLDLSHNNISGGLPHCFNNISVLAINSLYSTFIMELVWKGIEIEFGKNLLGMRSIDISSNYLIGEIPQSIESMTELISLNLSRNYLTGKLPENFGNMKMLESLDLSRNQISGKIPASFSRLNFLGVLDVSHNHLSGRIPLSTQLQSFNASAYMANLGLCGPPLTQICPGDGTAQDDGITRGSDTDNKEHDTDGLISLGFFISTALGFVTGFWVVCGSLLLKSSRRYAYFKFLDDSRDWVYVKTAAHRAKMERRLQRWMVMSFWHGV